MGLTQKQFAASINIKRYNLAKYETKTVVPGHILLRMQEFAGVIPVCDTMAQDEGRCQ
jgi:transcriptional regulator with XRE-family HTH domain